jgi:tRNA-specific 2-thiouridylase
MGKVKALGLCSGGLDSMLAGLVLKRQGIDVEWINFETPFFSAKNASKAAESANIPLTVLDITTAYLEMLKNPSCGYGKNMNPCLDCHAFMFKIAGMRMQDKGFDFMFSGEVLGQRPMSQTRPSLRYVEKTSGFDGYILRPLSAKLLSETVPERQGKVNRSLLFGFSGRSRKPQIELARQYGVTQYPAPAGGCLLTDKAYSDRLRDLFKHQNDCTQRDLYLLKYGRHIRLNSTTKIIAGRTKQDNDNIMSCYQPNLDTLLQVSCFPGPTVLIPHVYDIENILKAAAICSGYSKAPLSKIIDVETTTPEECLTVQVKGICPTSIKHLII